MSDNANVDTEKKTMLRSASYPGISIEEAIQFVSEIKKSFPASLFKREDIAAVLKKSSIHVDIAAAVQYGLVDRIGDSYKLAIRVPLILNSINEDEYCTAITDCFSTPKLYIELIERFKGHVIPPDKQLRAIITRFHAITESAAPKVADTFIENALFAKVLNENRILFSQLPEKQEILETKVDKQSHQVPPAEITQEQTSNKKPALLLEQINGKRDLKIYLSEKKEAYLIYPENINEKDIQILKYQIEALALTL